ncbi:hypothetical protein HAX54_040445 [Datura stramonium]|uniref:Uncharacterized protein n=1 Tax=Datura stramonium TaxID=4076 RepID=A0ABS8VMM2_DATST|nr:hypothetical protein [Datura stramonium]
MFVVCKITFSSVFSPEIILLFSASLGGQGEKKNDLPVARGGESRPIGSGRNSHSSADNGNYKHGGRRGLRDVDGTSFGEGKPVRRGGTSAYSSLEKQVWVQKSSSGS